MRGGGALNLSSWAILAENKSAFTLAEVLITLGIIGIVAAMTMPSLIADHRNKETAVKLKKVYSTLSQAYLSAVNENGTPDNWDLKGYFDADGAVNGLNVMAKYLNITKNCGSQPGCFYTTPNYYLNGSVLNPNYFAALAKAKLQLSDGTLVSFETHSETCGQIRGTGALQNVCAVVVVDINGAKLPNKVGRDIFAFNITKSNILPHGIQDDTQYPFDSTCNKSSSGWGCTAWVIYNENMDYLKCNDLSWDGKTKCE